MKSVLLLVIKTSAVLFLVLLIALSVRTLLEPDWHDPPDVLLQNTDLDELGQLLMPALLGQEELAERIRCKRYILVGETHFKKETVAYFLGLLEAIDNEPVVLLLEMPRSTQTAIDQYLASGDEQWFSAIWGEAEPLPLHEILRWAQPNGDRVRRVLAMDEDQTRIFFNRAILRDTRNETMAQEILRAADEYPDAKIVAYGGAMHMMLGGRYRYDVDNRQPAGLRLINSGVPRSEIASISLAGTELPVAAAWQQPGALEIDDRIGLLPYQFVYEYPIYGISRLQELHTHIVFLGQLTRQETWNASDK